MVETKLLKAYYNIKSICKILLEKKLITPSQLSILNKRPEYKDRIGSLLLKEGVISNEDLCLVIAEHFNTTYVNLKHSPPDKEVLDRNEVGKYIKFNFIPWRKFGGITYIATIDVTDEFFKYLKDRYCDGFRIVITSREDIIRSIQNNFSHCALESVKNDLVSFNDKYSARKLLHINQKAAIYAFLSLFLFFACLLPMETLKVFLIVINAFLFFNILSKAYFFYYGISSKGSKNSLHINIKKSSLPIYTILLPLFKEDYAITRLLNSIKNLDYPKSKLDVILIVEQYDRKTLKFLKSQDLDPFYQIISVPKSYPQTKPKACSYALRFAKGKYLTIYDVEDIPDRNQLLKAVEMFRSSPDNVVCLQSKLNYYNRGDNILSRLFSIEYSIWFDYLLKGLEKTDTPIPLGGTSNHFKLKVLRKLMGWDPYNVAEDADIGYRLAKSGYKTKILDSMTMEESPVRLKTWLYQRARWIKGHLQTYIVHLRTMSELRKHCGMNGVMGFHLFLFLPVISYFLQFIICSIMLFPKVSSWHPYLSLMSMVNYTTWIIFSVCLASFVVVKNRWKKMFWSVLLYPLYYLFHSIAFFMAVYQLFFNPHYWNKTPRKLEELMK